MQTRCSWWLSLWAEVLCDIWFGFFTAASGRRSHRHYRFFPWRPGCHVRAQMPTFFCHSLRHPNARRPFHLRQPCFIILCADSHTLRLFFFLVIYTFKHEICLIHCEVSQQASDHCDNINMPLCGLVAPWLEFHFLKTILVLFLVSFSSLVFNNPPSRCVHFYSAKIKSSSEKVELLAHRWD